jgi:ubiquinone biosynthesis monooxygenase Coq7
MEVSAFDTLPIGARLTRDLRSDHAGEVGAVEIYRGMLAVARSSELRAFASEHLETELRHREFFDNWLPRRHQSRLLWLWRTAGWVLGAASALLGMRAAFRTVAAVETFVEGHYQEQVQAIGADPALQALRDRLEQFCREEAEHKRDASRRLAPSDQAESEGRRSVWGAIVAGGSAVGVAIARRI